MRGRAGTSMQLHYLKTRRRGRGGRARILRALRKYRSVKKTSEALHISEEKIYLALQHSK
jgi:hypothetical protein